MDENKDGVVNQRPATEKKPGGITGKGFMKGKSGNPKGRPKDFNALRKLAQQIGNESIELKDGTQRTRIENILRDWSVGEDAQLQKGFVEIAYGKVPNPVEHTGKDGGPIDTRDVTEYTDDERIARAAALFDSARARRDRPAAEGSVAVDASAVADSAVTGSSDDPATDGQ